MDLGTVLDLLTLALVAIGLLLWRLFGAAAEHATKAQVDEVMAELHQASALARELERTRGTERQELRFTSYGKLWAELRPLAIYDDSTVDHTTMSEMSKKLSGWYFSETGGLMLTSHNRDLYFALQDLVSAVADQPGWEAERTREPREIFLVVLERRELTAARALMKYLDDVDISGWPSTDTEALARAWRSDVAKLAEGWPELSREKERFAVLQQVASVLRTGLTYDVESRLR